MSLVDHPLTTPVAAPKTTRLERNTPSEAAYAQYDEHADRYEPAESPPSPVPDQDTGYIEGFFKAENCKENVLESINTISIFCIPESVIKFRLSPRS